MIHDKEAGKRPQGRTAQRGPVADRDTGGLLGVLRRNIAIVVVVCAGAAVTFVWQLGMEHRAAQARHRASAGYGASDGMPTGDVATPRSAGRPHVCLDDYPAVSARLGEQGTTTLGFTITEDGTPVDIRVVSSSGSERLDAAAKTCAQGWHYKPATRHGDPVAVPWKAEVKWILH